MRVYDEVAFAVSIAVIENIVGTPSVFLEYEIFKTGTRIWRNGDRSITNQSGIDNIYFLGRQGPGFRRPGEPGNLVYEIRRFQMRKIFQ